MRKKFKLKEYINLFKMNKNKKKQLFNITTQLKKKIKNMNKIEFQRNFFINFYKMKKKYLFLNQNRNQNNLKEENTKKQKYQCLNF